MANLNPRAHFLSCDWGTSRVRLEAVTLDGLQRASAAESDRGAHAIDAAARRAGNTARERAALFSDALGALVAELASAEPAAPDAPIAISGMASSSIGWRELPYGALPLALDAACEGGVPSARIDTGCAARPALLISGLADREDVLRGEEVQILGLLDGHPEFSDDALLILPGTHSKHVRIDKRSVVGFETFMTGELYGLLARESVLASSVATDALASADWTASREQTEAFAAGCRRGAARPLPSALFSVRARAVLGKVAPEESAAFLSGILIGAELAPVRGGAHRRVLIAPPAGLHAAYSLADRTLELAATVADPDELAAATRRSHAGFLRAAGLL